MTLMFKVLFAVSFLISFSKETYPSLISMHESYMASQPTCYINGPDCAFARSEMSTHATPAPLNMINPDLPGTSHSTNIAPQYTNVILIDPAQNIPGTSRNSIIYTHAMCKKCLRHLINTKTLFKTKCKLCDKLISYAQMVMYLKNTIFCSTKLSAENPEDLMLLKSLINELLKTEGAYTLIYSMSLKSKDEIEKLSSAIKDILQVEENSKTVNTRLDEMNKTLVNVHYEIERESRRTDIYRLALKGIKLSRSFPRQESFENDFNTIINFYNEARGSTANQFLSAKLLALLGSPTTTLEELMSFNIPYAVQEIDYENCSNIKNYIDEFRGYSREVEWNEDITLQCIINRNYNVPTQNAIKQILTSYSNSELNTMEKICRLVARNANRCNNDIKTCECAYHSILKDMEKGYFINGKLRLEDVSLIDSLFAGRPEIRGIFIKIIDKWMYNKSFDNNSIIETVENAKKTRNFEPLLGIYSLYNMNRMLDSKDAFLNIFLREINGDLDLCGQFLPNLVRYNILNAVSVMSMEALLSSSDKEPTDDKKLLVLNALVFYLVENMVGALIYGGRANVVQDKAIKRNAKLFKTKFSNYKQIFTDGIKNRNDTAIIVYGFIRYYNFAITNYFPEFADHIITNLFVLSDEDNGTVFRWLCYCRVNTAIPKYKESLDMAIPHIFESLQDKNILRIYRSNINSPYYCDTLLKCYLEEQISVNNKIHHLQHAGNTDQEGNVVSPEYDNETVVNYINSNIDFYNQPNNRNFVSLEDIRMRTNNILDFLASNGYKVDKNPILFHTKIFPLFSGILLDSAIMFAQNEINPVEHNVNNLELMKLLTFILILKNTQITKQEITNSSMQQMATTD